ncbi:MAG: hypothetical protein HWN67_04950 [Candidatus Helarchaeota archaeon]|nr:hypothetical protein [Candidatus Helarchaeota archaeon]
MVIHFISPKFITSVGAGLRHGPAPARKKVLIGKASMKRLSTGIIIFGFSIFFISLHFEIFY